MVQRQYSIQCNDDTAEIPAGIEHTPAIVLNPDAHPLVLLSTAAARALRIQQTIEPYAMMTGEEGDATLDGRAAHALLTARFHQSQELHQMLCGCIARIHDNRDSQKP